MRKHWIVLIAFVAVVVLTLQYIFYSPDFPPPPESCDSNAIGPQDYLIYRTLLKERHSGPRVGAGATILVYEGFEIPEVSLSPSDFSIERLQAEIVKSGEDLKLSPDTVANFSRMSTDVISLDRQQFLDLPLVLASQAEISDVFAKDDGWAALGTSNIVRFSRIGFSCQRNQALVYESQSCGSLCGSGGLLILKKDEDRWRVVLGILLWIS